MSFNKPTVGRIVHYSPNGKSVEMELQGRSFYAAMVVSIAEGGEPNLSIFTDMQHAPQVLKPAVPHQTDAAEGQPFWTWPEIVQPAKEEKFPEDKRRRTYPGGAGKIQG